MSIVRYEVPMVAQNLSPVCWLACAIMLLQFKRGETLRAEDIGIKGEDFRTGSVANVKSNAIVHERLRRMGFTVTRLAARPRGCAPPDEEAIHGLLASHGPFLLCHFMGSFWYGPTRTRPRPSEGLPPGQHCVLVTGHDSRTHRVYFHNPWGDVDVPTTASSIVASIRRYEAWGEIPIAYLP